MMDAAIMETVIVFISAYFYAVGILSGIGILSGMAGLGVLAWGPTAIPSRKVAVWLLVTGWTALAVHALIGDALAARLSG